MNLLSPTNLRLWAAVALACLVAAPALAEEGAAKEGAAGESSAEEASNKVEVPPTQNKYIPVVAMLYEQADYKQALNMLEKALELKSNGEEEVVWLKLMQGVLQAELAPGASLGSFKEALELDKQAQLPVKGSWRLRKLFEQARNTVGLPVDPELVAEEVDPSLLETGWQPPPRPQGWSVSVHGEVDLASLDTIPSLISTEKIYPVIPAVDLGYAAESMGGVLTVLVAKPSLALRAEGRYHPLTLGWVRPYAGLGATLFLMEQGELQPEAPRAITPLGGVGGRVTLGLDVQFTERLNAFAGVAYERFLGGSQIYKPDSVVFSLGVGWSP